MSKTKTVRTYNVYDHNDKLIASYQTKEELYKAFDIKSDTNLYNSARNGIFFKPNFKDKRFIRVEIIREKVEKEKPSRFKDFRKYTEGRNRVESLDNEEWREIPGYPGNWCSNLGRFKFEKEDVCTTLVIVKAPNSTKKIYTDVSLLKLDDDGKVLCSESFRTSRVIAKTWIDSTLNLSFKEDKRVVDHIDNNSRNEKVENLRVLTTNGANIKAAIYEQGKKVGKDMKKCYAYNINTKEEREYESSSNLVDDIWHKENNGYFNKAYKNKNTTKDGWRVGYSLEEIKSR